MALRDVQDLLALEERGDSDPGELDLAVSQLQEAMFGLNRRLLSERKADQGPLQGLKNTLGSLKDELFADDDDWDDWNRPASDPWSRQGDWSRPPSSRSWSESERPMADRWSPREQGYQDPREWPRRDADYPESRQSQPAYSDRYRQDDRDDRFPESAEPPAPVRMPRRNQDTRPPEDDPWAER
jgi:molecular chaperone DnaK